MHSLSANEQTILPKGHHVFQHCYKFQQSERYVALGSPCHQIVVALVVDSLLALIDNQSVWYMAWSNTRNFVVFRHIEP